MNLKQSLAAILLLTTLLFSCTKESTSDNAINNNPDATNLEITAYLNGVAQSGASVFLFTSKYDWDAFVYSGAATYVSSTVTDAKGNAAFINLEAYGNYYWYVSKGCENSYEDSLNTSGTLMANTTNQGLVNLKGYGSVLFTNVNNTWNANVYIDNVYYGNVTHGGGTLLVNTISPGSHAIKATNTLTSPANGTITVTECQTSNVTVNL